MVKLKKKQQSKATLRKGKKKWFSIVTPDYLHSIELGEITAFEPANLPGRMVSIPLKEITKSPRDSTSKIKFIITKVQGETCQLEPVELSVQDSQVQRMDRRAKDKIVKTVDAVTKDKQKIRIKVYILLSNKVARSVQTVLQTITENYVSDFIKTREVKNIFTTMTPKTIANNLKKDLSKIYPANVIIWKIKKIQ
jgi:ribosomal protein S3AE